MKPGSLTAERVVRECESRYTVPMRILCLFASAVLLSSCCDRAGTVPSDLTLPESSTADALHEAGVRVFLSRSELRVNDQSIGKFASLGPGGFDATWKKNGDADELLLNGMMQVLASQKTQGDGGWGEATLYVDGATPYRALTEVLYTLGQSELSKWHVVVATGPKRGSKSFEVPAYGDLTGAGPGAELIDMERELERLAGASGSASAAATPGSLADLGTKPPSLPKRTPPFRVTIRTTTIETRGADGPCVATKRGDAYDFARLTACAAAASAKEGAKREWAYVGADPHVDFKTVIQVVDAIATSYPKVGFTVAR